jgi:hypothetical protein
MRVCPGRFFGIGDPAPHRAPSRATSQCLRFGRVRLRAGPSDCLWRLRQDTVQDTAKANWRVESRGPEATSLRSHDAAIAARDPTKKSGTQSGNRLLARAQSKDRR